MKLDTTYPVNAETVFAVEMQISSRDLEFRFDLVRLKSYLASYLLPETIKTATLALFGSSQQISITSDLKFSWNYQNFEFLIWFNRILHYQVQNNQICALIGLVSRFETVKFCLVALVICSHFLRLRVVSTYRIPSEKSFLHYVIHTVSWFMIVNSWANAPL